MLNTAVKMVNVRCIIGVVSPAKAVKAGQAINRLAAPMSTSIGIFAIAYLAIPPEVSARLIKICNRYLSVKMLAL